MPAAAAPSAAPPAASSLRGVSTMSMRRASAIDVLIRRDLVRMLGGRTRPGVLGLTLRITAGGLSPRRGAVPGARRPPPRCARGRFCPVLLMAVLKTDQLRVAYARRTYPKRCRLGSKPRPYLSCDWSLLVQLPPITSIQTARCSRVASSPTVPRRATPLRAVLISPRGA